MRQIIGIPKAEAALSQTAKRSVDTDQQVRVERGKGLGGGGYIVLINQSK